MDDIIREMRKQVLRRNKRTTKSKKSNIIEKEKKEFKNKKKNIIKVIIVLSFIVVLCQPEGA